MKSDLSKFRMPKREPLKSKENPGINKNLNKTPLSSMAESAPKIPRSTTTVNKEGVNPQKVSQTEKFKGETTPKVTTNVEKFKGETTPKPMSLEERYLGQTDPKLVNQTEKFKGETNPTLVNQTEKFKGETSPTEMSNKVQFLGETTPKETNNQSQFLGETNPKEANNQSQFLGETTPNTMDTQSGEKFLGETTPKTANNSEQFLGETNPKEANNQSQFLGETTPKTANNSEQYLGETTPNTMDAQSGEKFLGETTPTEANNQSKFLGETTPTLANNESKFLGETTPNESDTNSKFLGETTPNESDRSSKFLGETTPNESDRSSKFLGETTPLSSDRSSKFLGETSPTPMNIPNGENGLGETTPKPMSLEQRFLGETTPNKMNIPNGENGLGETSPTPMNIPNGEKGLGETTPTDFSFKKKLEKEGKDFKEVNNLLDIHSKGFTSKFGGVEATKFIGVNPNNSVFDSANSLYSNISNNTFTLGKTYGSSYNDAGGINSGEEGFGIGKGQAKRQSPSFLDEQYNKFNLKDDSFNTGLGLFRHPLILRGIQRRGISKGEPQRWGIGGFAFDDGLIRGGIVTSTVRAAVDVARIGAWMASVEGLLWGVKQLGLQASNPNVETGLPFNAPPRLTKIWTPVNLLANILTQHTGIRHRRHGITPFDPFTGGYSEVQNIKKVGQIDDTTLTKGPFANRLGKLWDNTFSTTGGIIKGVDEAVKGLAKLKNAFSGGPQSLYGLAVGLGANSLGENTLKSKFEGYSYKKQYNDSEGQAFDRDKTPLAVDNEISTPSDVDKADYLDKKLPKELELPTSDDGREYNTEEKYYQGSSRPADLKEFADGTDLGQLTYTPGEKNTDGESHPLEKLDTSDIIKHYETLAYGNIPERGAGDTQVNDFRSLLTGAESERSTNSNYTENNLEYNNKFPNPGKVGADRTDYTPIDENGGNTRWDVVNALRGVATEDETLNDLVKFYIQPIGTEEGKFYQFRGTISGLTETFSPSWDSIKFSGRADQGYKYGSFERSVSFNFQMWATSRIEMKPMYEKLEALSTFTMPEYHTNRGYQGMLMKFTLGDLYKNKLSFIDSLTYTFSDDAPWDINLDASDLGVRPMGIDVAIGFKVLDTKRPQYLGEVYDLGWERG